MKKNVGVYSNEIKKSKNVLLRGLSVFCKIISTLSLKFQRQHYFSFIKHSIVESYFKS